MSTPEICGNCRFWETLPRSVENLVGDDEAGECRRFPPRLALEFLCEKGVGESNEGDYETIDGPARFLYTHFAVTLKDCWCGEFKQRIPLAESITPPIIEE